MLAGQDTKWCVWVQKGRVCKSSYGLPSHHVGRLTLMTSKHAQAVHGVRISLENGCGIKWCSWMFHSRESIGHVGGHLMVIMMPCCTEDLSTTTKTSRWTKASVTTLYSSSHIEQSIIWGSMQLNTKRIYHSKLILTLVLIRER